MLDETYARGEAVVRIKTDLHHPNPAVREWPALRISIKPHPRMGSRYRVWPLYNFSCAIDDHEMDISHIIRGKEHEVNTTRQRYIFKYLCWDFPEIINVGRLGLEAGVLSKSKIRRGVEEGTFAGWDDPRVGTLRALKRRGIQPDTIRSIIIEVGSKPVNATLSWGNISAANRRVIESNADRYFFVADPTSMSVSGVEQIYDAKLPLHLNYPDRGTRDYRIEPDSGQVFLVISRSDAAEMKQGQIMRLMGLFNIEIIKVEEVSVHGVYHSKNYQEARTLNAPFIHWLPYQAGIDARAVMPDATVVGGLAEPACLDLEIGAMIQFERFGFVRVDGKDPFVVYYSHR
jgi:glutamyl-tRNA synthetase